MIHILIPVHNRLDFTISCIKSILNQKNCEKLKIIIVDDGSTDGTKEYLKKNYPQITILKGSGSMYWGGAINFGVQYIKKNSNENDWLLIVNNDTILKPNTISELIKSSNQNYDKCLVGALTIDLKDKKTIVKSGSSVKSWFLNKTEHLFEGLNIDNLEKKTKLFKVDYLTGRCVLHPIKIFSFMGNYDSKNFPHYGADDEFTFRVKKFGYECLICISSIVYLDIEDNKKLPNNIIKRFMFILFDIKSSSNILNKYTITTKMVPNYAKISYLIIGVMKSFFIFLRSLKKK